MSSEVEPIGWGRPEDAGMQQQILAENDRLPVPYGPEFVEEMPRPIIVEGKSKGSAD